MKADRCSRPGRAIDSIIEVIKSNTTTAAWTRYSNSFFYTKGVVCDQNVTDTSPFESLPVTFAWDRHLYQLGKALAASSTMPKVLAISSSVSARDM